MTIEMPIRCGGFRVACERSCNDPNDTHYPIFDAKQGCVAHVFDASLALKMEKAVNSFDAVCEALEGCLQFLRRGTPIVPSCKCDRCSLVLEAEAVLAAAKGIQ